MKIITNNEIDWANKIEQEILADSANEWWLPQSSEHKIFEQAYMKFVNGNLNYFKFEIMIAALLEETNYNKNLTETLNFCNYARLLTGDTGPFGRMCVWKLPPKKELLRHRDNFKYHKHIVRNIFIVSKHSSNNCNISINDKLVDFNQGTLFQFFPATDQHAFANNSDRDFYFVGFDYWITKYLNKSIIETKDAVSKLMRNHHENGFDKKGINCKFISAH
jgi:hypothetical protein